MKADLPTVMAKLQARPGRGGIRLSYEEARLVVGLIEAGARAVARERNGGTRELTVDEFLEASDIHKGPTILGKGFVA